MLPYGTIHQDIQDGFPRLGTPGQRTIICACCGAFGVRVDGVADRWFMRRGGRGLERVAGAGRAVWHVPAGRYPILERRRRGSHK